MPYPHRAITIGAPHRVVAIHATERQLIRSDPPVDRNEHV